MTVLSPAKRTAICAKITLLEARLDDAYDVLEAALSSADKSYKLDTTEGMQAAVKRDYTEIWGIIETIERQLDHLDRRLNGNLNMNMNARRKSFYGARLRGMSW